MLFMQKPESPDQQTTFSMQMIGVYIFTTAVLLIALFILTQNLSQQPRYISPGNESRPAGWQVVTNQAQTFTFNLPSDWVWYDSDEIEQAQLFQSTVTNNEEVLETAVSFFRRIDPETKIQMVALLAEADITPAPILFVAGSNRLHQLSPELLVDAVKKEVSGVQQAEIETRPGNRQIANIMVDFSTQTDVLRCAYQFTHNEDAGYILAGCAPGSQFGRIGRDLPGIQNSFQLLVNKE